MAGVWALDQMFGCWDFVFSFFATEDTEFFRGRGGLDHKGHEGQQVRVAGEVVSGWSRGHGMQRISLFDLQEDVAYRQQK